MNFKHSGQNVHLSADSGNSSCYSSVHKSNNTSIADVGSFPVTVNSVIVGRHNW